MFDNLNKKKEFIPLNSCQYSYYASDIGVSIYVRFGPILESDIPEIRPFDRVTDIPFNFLLLAKVSDEKLKEYLVNFEKLLISILKKELFSWRFKLFCLNKKKIERYFMWQVSLWGFISVSSNNCLH